LGAIVVSIFASALYPFRGDLLQVLHRVFPLARGLFEDKVANFWCVSNIVIKWRNMFTTATLLAISLVATVASILPACLYLFVKPNRIVETMVVSALGFYMFSFQVHEKAILLPLLPATLLMGGDARLAGVLFNNVGAFTMYPLLVRDGLVLQVLIFAYVSTFALWDCGI
jgi:alpha-1,3-glucosyltransferase